jgi:hypothetical protein
VAIEADTLAGAVEQLREHLNRVLARTVTETRLVTVTYPRDQRPSAIHVAFRQAGRATEAPLRTRYGRMRLYLGQQCDSAEHEGRHRLYTASYRYTLRHESATEPVLRWEYLREWPDSSARWCRHHIQGDVTIPLGGGVSLNELHAPTGFVTIEEILRFCIVDLGVDPLAPDWHETLEESYRLFKESFTP